MSTNIVVDNYIKKAAPFAQPILVHLRKLVHSACPTVEENIKWGMPSFEYKGLMCGFAAFKNHCTFGFWKAVLMKDPMLVANAKTEVAMGHLGRITSIEDLPSDKKIIGYIKEAMQLNDDGIKVTKTKPITVKELVIPKHILETIKKNKKAFATFEVFSTSNKRDYVEWIAEAKTQATKDSRLAQAIEWMAEGKPRNWKYMKEYR
ncbi:MAG: DUF1801 domain-containing protein [Bacteroidetes bacterium]|nr:DUF1801 domain-containing protein [Bacteroidota bacterium]